MAVLDKIVETNSYGCTHMATFCEHLHLSPGGWPPRWETLSNEPLLSPHSDMLKLGLHHLACLVCVALDHQGLPSRHLSPHKQSII